MREKFVQNFVKSTSTSAKDAYQETYHTTTDISSRTAASRLLNVPEVKSRLAEVFEAQGLTDDYITNKLKDLTNARKESVQLGAVRTVLEVRKDIDNAPKVGVLVEVNKRLRVSHLVNKYSNQANLQSLELKKAV